MCGGSETKCRHQTLIGTIVEELNTLLTELCSDEYEPCSFDEEDPQIALNPQIALISDAMRDLLLYNSEGDLERAKLHRRYLEISKILELILVISVTEGDLPQDLKDSLSEAIAKLLADIYSGC